MREVVTDVCPNLQLENQPDINPGLMKHVLDEIRKLKTELAFQHNTILELTHQIESYESKNKQKDRLIEKLLHRCRDVRLDDGQGGQSTHGMILSGSQSRSQPLHSATSFDPADILQFGSIDCLSDLSIDLQDVQAYLLENDHGGAQMVTEGMAIPQASTSPSRLSNVHSHAITNDISVAAIVPRGGGSNEKAINSAIAEGTSSSDIPCSLDQIPSGERWRNRRAVLGACSKLGLIVVTCKMMHRLTGQ